MRAAVLLAGLLAGCALQPPAQAAPPPVLKGPWVQGGTIVGKAAPGSAVFFNGRELKLTPEGHFVFGLDRDEKPVAELILRRPDGSVSRYEYEVAEREYQVQRIDGLPASQVTPPKRVHARLAREAKLLRAARYRHSERGDFAHPFTWPCIGPISGVYGSQRILNGVPKQPHYGVDVAVPTGTKVFAPAGGQVTLAQRDLYYTGGTLMIDHGHGLVSSFLHLSKLLVAEGQEVRQGELIAEVGATGRVTGPHLDWRVSWLDARVDPQLLVPPMPDVAE